MSITFGPASRWAAAVVAVAVLVAGSATAFGYQFARESHGHDDEAEMAHADSEAAETHGGEASHEQDEDDGAMLASAIAIGLAGGALGPLTGRVARRREGEASADSARGRASTLPLQLAALSIGAAIIHFAVIGEHWDEWWLAAIFFIAVALFQLAWAMLACVPGSVPLVMLISAALR